MQIELTGSYKLPIKVKKLHEDAVIPTRATVGSAGFDLYSIEDKTITLAGSRIFRTGLAFEIPEGHYMSILGRSGLAFKSSIITATGTIDSDYRGEVRVKVFSLGLKNIEIKKGDRIAQAVILPVPQVEFIEVEELGNTDRGAGGFGSTGR